MTDLNELARKCKEISDARQKNGGVGNDPLKHCAGEVVEAVEAREYLNIIRRFDTVALSEKTTQEIAKADYAEELADVIICPLIAAADDGIDIESAVLNKIKKNEARALGLGDKL